MGQGFVWESLLPANRSLAWLGRKQGCWGHWVGRPLLFQRQAVTTTPQRHKASSPVWVSGVMPVATGRHRRKLELRWAGLAGQVSSSQEDQNW